MKRIFAALAVASSFVLPVAAQEWPTQQVRVIVPFAAGAGTDRVARLMAEELGRQTGQTFVVDNRPGAGAIAGTEAVVRSRKDGHTILFTTPSLAYSKLLFAKLPFDPEADLRPVATVGHAPYLLLANNNFPATTPSAIADLLKREPGRHNYGSAGVGTATHFVFELFLVAAGNLKATHVPYKGAAAAMTDLIGGQVPLLVDPASGATPHVLAGKVKAVAATSSNRLPTLPNVPTFKELGYPDLEVYGWYMALVPTGTPDAVVRRMSAAIRKAITDPAVAKKMAEVSVDVPPESSGTPEGAQRFLASEFKRWTEVARQAGIKPE